MLAKDINKEAYEKAVRPLMEYLGENHHPHVTVIVTSTIAELVEGIRSLHTDEYVKD